ncbi:MAG: hypothetical protein PHQ33_08560, partial [Bacteroidales bacterium]|nr:hypothetical protein [Bacteroidales bacterium]
MNCQHCQAQWTPPPTMSVSNCPFCGKPLVDIATLGNHAKPEIILRQVVERFDVAILSEKRLSAILKDLMPHVEQKYKRIFTQAVSDGVGQKLYELQNQPETQRTATIHILKENFRTHNGYDHTADYVFD